MPNASMKPDKDDSPQAKRLWPVEETILLVLLPSVWACIDVLTQGGAGHGSLVLLSLVILRKHRTARTLKGVAVGGALAVSLPGVVLAVTGNSHLGDSLTRLVTLFTLWLIAKLLGDRERLLSQNLRMRETHKKMWRKSVELERSNAELEQFAYVASHDLREPLRMVTGYLSLLADEYRDKIGNEGQEYIDFAVNGAHRMKHLIDDLLAYSRTAAPDTKQEPVNLTEVLQEVMHDLHEVIHENQAEIIFTDLPFVAGDKGQLRQVFQNLLNNAIKFRTHNNPRVEITAAWYGEFWQFSVQDNGIGVEKDHAEHVFGMFKRLHTQTEYSGTGIGLTICKKVIERHGGTIWLESELGQGCNFLFQLPAI